MTYQEILTVMKRREATLSCSFGYQGEDNYSEIWHGKDGVRWMINRKDHYETSGWTIKEI